jgi:hypothetical protein
MGDMKLTFGKSRVRSHVKTSQSGKQIAVGEYTTKRPPGKVRQHIIYNMGQLTDTPDAIAMRAKAAACHHGKVSTGRQTCECEPCGVWRNLKARKDYRDKTSFQKAIDRIDGFLKRYWQKTSNLFKAESTPFAVLLADDLASARDNGPQDDIVQDHEQLPWAAEDHAAAPPVEEEAPAEVEQITKARQIQKALQAEIEALDQQLAHPLDHGLRGELLAKHLDRLVQADRLAERLEEGEQAAKVVQQIWAHPRY